MRASGPRMAEQITAFFCEPKNAAVLAAPHQARHPRDRSLPSDNPRGSRTTLGGKKIVFTAASSRLSLQAKELAERLGARVTGSVSKATSWVVVGEDAGSKADDARKHSVATLDEEGFLALLREHGVEV